MMGLIHILFPRIIRALAFFAAVLMFSGATTAWADMQEILDKGVIRHLGVRYARFVTGSGDGLSTDLVKGFADEIGVRYEYVETSWKTVISDLTGKAYRIVDGQVEITGDTPIKGDIIANGLTILSWRKQLLDYSTPTFPSGVWLIARADSALQPIRPSNSTTQDTETVKSLLHGVSVLCMYGTCLDPGLYGLEATGAKLVPLNLQMNEFAPAVIKQDAESSLLDVADALIALEKWPGQLKVIGPISLPQEMGCGFRKADVKLREHFNRYLRSLRSDGRYMQLVQHYYPGVEAYFPKFFEHR
jgi:ABC-type amino acid transport substrate-binding protein